jgi:hypothetical protein
MASGVKLKTKAFHPRKKKVAVMHPMGFEPMLTYVNSVLSRALGPLDQRCKPTHTEVILVYKTTHSK